MSDAPRQTLLDRVRPFCDGRGSIWLAGLAALLSARTRQRFSARRSLVTRALAHLRAGAARMVVDLPHAQLVDEPARGFWSWWSSPRLAIQFCRPLSSLKFRYWPDSPMPMLLLSIAIYAALVWVAAKLYRQLNVSAYVAALAGLMFAVDEAHGAVLDWLAARNTLLATLASLTAPRFSRA